MTFATGFTLAVLLLAVIGLVKELLSPDTILLAALAALVAAGVVDLETALEGFANPTLVAIGALFVVAEGLRRSGLLRKAGTVLLGGATHLRAGLLRLTTTSAASSAFLNNTPIVAMGIPTVLSWAEDRDDITPSKLLIPLSWASMLGGVCTLIGTSTNLVADGLLRAEGYTGLGFFELARVGVPLAGLGILLLVTVIPALLPDRKALHQQREDQGIMRWSRGQADFVYRVPEGAPVAGSRVEEADLEGNGVDLVRISRGSSLLAPVGPDELVREGDYLVLRGEEEPMAELAERCGLEPAAPRHTLRGPFRLREAVIPEGSRLARERVGDTRFPDRYGALVTGVFRNGAAVRREPEHIRLRAGDTLLLETTDGFARAHATSPDFYVVGRESTEPEDPVPFWRPTRAKWGGAILLAVIGLAVFDVAHISLAALGGAVLMVATGFLSPGDARRSVDWSVLIVIGAALGIGNAMEASGAADLLGRGVVSLGRPFGPMGVLAAVVLSCSLLTGLITNNAAIALLFPVAVSAAISMDADPRPFVIGATVAASISFATPLGYQTNLMVYGPGGYRFVDFVKAGLPLQLLLAGALIVLIPLLWPL